MTTRRASPFLVTLLVVLLAGCGGTTAASNSDPRATLATPSPTATSIPSPTPLPTADPSQIAHACGVVMSADAVVVGGVAIARNTHFGNLAYPGAQLPDGLPLNKPYQVGRPSPGDSPTTPVNPNLYSAGGYVISVCNISDAPHIIQTISARIETVQPYPGKLNEWPACTGPAFVPPSSSGPGGCGGGDGQSIFLQAQFPLTATEGDSVIARQVYVNPNGSDYPGGVKFPATLKPGDTLTIEIDMGTDTQSGVVQFNTPGFYSFSFAVGVDDAAPVSTTLSPTTLLAPIAHSWTGPACDAPAMKQLITAPGYYLCPTN